MEQLFQLLNSIMPLTEAMANELIPHVKFKEIQRKDYLLKAGHVCRNIYFIDKGLLRCFYKKGDDEYWQLLF